MKEHVIEHNGVIIGAVIHWSARTWGFNLPCWDSNHWRGNFKTKKLAIKRMVDDLYAERARLNAVCAASYACILEEIQRGPTWGKTEEIEQMFDDLCAERARLNSLCAAADAYILEVKP